VRTRAIDLRGHVDERHRGHGFEVSRRPRLDPPVARFLQQHRQPAGFELGTVGDQQVGGAGARDEARLGLDRMHVLQRARGAVHVDLVAAEFGRERRPVGRRGEHLHGRLRGQREHQAHRGERGAAEQ